MVLSLAINVYNRGKEPNPRMSVSPNRKPEQKGTNRKSMRAKAVVRADGGEGGEGNEKQTEVLRNASGKAALFPRNQSRRSRRLPLQQ
jgi:hypothetical protein